MSVLRRTIPKVHSTYEREIQELQLQNKNYIASSNIFVPEFRMPKTFLKDFYLLMQKERKLIDGKSIIYVLNIIKFS